MIWQNKKIGFIIQRRNQRKESGSMLAILALGVLLAIFTVGVLSLDIAHNVTTRTALQNAADAGALAGATVLVVSNVRSTVDPPVVAAATQAAKDRAASNTADGHSVAANDGCTLNPAGLPYVIPPNPAGAGGVSDNNGECQVGASVDIKNMFAGIFGHPSDTVNVQSIATGYTCVTGVDQNILFPIAVSLDTLAGHDPNTPTNKPLYLSHLGDTVEFYLKEPCANAAWTTYNTGKDAGATAAEVDAAAVKYIDKALDSTLGKSYEQGLIPPQTVGEKNAAGGGGVNGGISLLGSLSGTKDLSKLLLGKTIVLPIVAGDLPYWEKDVNGDGSQYAPGKGQIRPLLGFCSIQVTKVIYDTKNNSLELIAGKLVKTLVKGTVGQTDPLIDQTANAAENYQAQDIQALAELSPGIVQLGASNLMALTTPQPDLSLFYHNHAPAGANSVNTDGINVPAPISANLQDAINKDLSTIPANEGINFAKPPDVIGAIAVIPSDDPANKPVDTIMHNPKTDLVIQAHFADEVDLNKGNYIVGTAYNPVVGAKNAALAPSYKVIDEDGTVLQDWAPMAIGQGGASGGNKTYPLTLTIPGKSLPEGEHLVLIHTYDIDLGHGGDHTPTANPPFYGDAAYYYLDLQNPTCPDL